jgi:uncharacterized protein YndB with AHSA1/START domain
MNLGTQEENMMTIVSAEIRVKASPAQAYRAFTNATALREWLCDVATVEAHPRGRMYLWWNGDFYSSGHYLELEENKRARFRWYSSIDPAPTEVEVSFGQQDGGTLVRMDHHVPDDPAWAKLAEGFRKNWQDSLENLQSVLETGLDLRIANRPMIGITLNDFSSEIAARLGVPVHEGLRLSGVVDGMGAQAAGLQADDVLVEVEGHRIGNDFGSFVVAIQGKKGGDTVNLVLYRGAEKKMITMRLSKRPMPDVPFDRAELAKRARAVVYPKVEAVEQAFAGYSDAEAATRPQPEDWSALEVVAHLIHNERVTQDFFATLVTGAERVSDGGGANVDSQVRATLATYPSSKEMLGELRRSVEETLRMAELLPQDFVLNRGSFYRVGQALLQADVHFDGHLAQLQAALASGRQAA